MKEEKEIKEMLAILRRRISSSSNMNYELRRRISSSSNMNYEIEKEDKQFIKYELRNWRCYRGASLGVG